MLLFNYVIWLVVFVLLIFLCYSLILLFRRRTRKGIIMLILFIVMAGYYVLIRERDKIMMNADLLLYSSTEGYFRYMLKEHGRLPMNILEISSDSSEGIIPRGYDRPAVYKPFILKQPKLGIKTWIDDTMIHSVLYSYGLDYDDDKLTRSYYFLLNPSTYNTWDYIKYVISPVPMTGDVIVRWIEHHIAYPYFDTVFVRELMEKHGDTLTIDEYNMWLEKREELRESLED